MKSYLTTALLAVLLTGPQILADNAGDGGTKVSFAYDVDFEMNFDNREYNTTLSPSMTIFGARLTPAVGVALTQAGGTTHRVLVGIDIMKNFGKGADIVPGTQQHDNRYSNADLFREVTLYYQLSHRMGRTQMNITAGIFPKRFSRMREYSPAFVSDSLKFYDNNSEGLLVTFTRPKSYYGIGCDWMGMFGTWDRERFMIYASGESAPVSWLSLGYFAYMYHYACSATVDGVVDNILVNPWIRFDAGPAINFQRLSLTLGWLQGAQQDRLREGKYVLPGGLETVFDIRNWNVGIRNRLYWGSNMMPYYNRLDAGGYKYGSDLYWGDPFYRSRLYDRLEVYYEPGIADCLSLRLSVSAHFIETGYAGLQQQIGLVFNLQELLSGLKSKNTKENRQ